MEQSDSQKRENDEKIARDEQFGGTTLVLDEGYSSLEIKSH
jgi:hypothetical protein